MSRRVAFNTLGCKLNQHETDSIASQFQNAGYRIVDFDEQADVYVLNTCTVTNKADRKSRNLINRAVRNAGMAEDAASAPAHRGAVSQAVRSAADTRHETVHYGNVRPAAVAEPPKRAADRPARSGLETEAGSEPEPLVVVTGCFAQSHKEELEQDGRTLVVDNDRKSHIFELVEAHLRGEMLHPESLDPELFSYGAAEPLFHTRSMVKIQDGCDNFCTFCIIPHVRGRAQSRPAEQVLMDVSENVRRGYREIVLTGVNMSRYDEEGTSFGELVERILELPGDFRLRISSLEPDSLDERFLRSLEHPKMCPHLHLCLQSGSERMLLKMRRQYTVKEYREIAEEIRRRRPGFNLTTDIIVGFPGETEEDFAESCRVARELEFSHIHTFKYSKRKGTRAARMPDQVDEQVKTERSAIIREISDENKRRYRERHIGETRQLLVERVEEPREASAAPGTADAHGEVEGDSWARGYAEHYVPVSAAIPEAETNAFYPVRITGITEDEDPVLIGEPV